MLAPFNDKTPEPPQMVESSAFEFENMERFLEGGRFTDLKVVCGKHTFRVHRLIVAANCPYFEDLLSKGSKVSSILGDGRSRTKMLRDQKKMDEIVLDDGEDPAMVARLIYFLYTGSYPTTHITNLKGKSFSKLSDGYVTTGQLNFLHAKMFCVGIDYQVPELRHAASQAFRSLDHRDFCQDPNWPALVEYIYISTPSYHRDLRNIVVREVLYATHHDRSRFEMQDLKKAIKRTPELAVDLATIALTDRKFRCDECKHDQYLLILPCSHKEKHEPNDSDCFKLSLEDQECSNCHDFDAFNGAAE